MINKESHSSDLLSRSSGRKVMTKKSAAAVAAFFLLASIAVIIAIAVVQKHKRTYDSPGMKYGIVLDAGSSRTTVYLYQWPAEKENDTGVVTETMKCQVKGPGISSLKESEQQEIESWKNIKACMANVTKAIPNDKHNSTPIFLGATAGMRLLKMQDESTSAAILSDIQNYMQSLPFVFQNASIISGQEEGLYGWITVNYLKGNLREKNLWNALVRPQGVETVGSLDLGGASTQIAFSVPDNLQGEDFIKVKLYGYEYNVYTHSFLCYGKNEAEKRVLASLVKSSADLDQVQHPCYPSGFNITMTTHSIFDSVCTQKPDKVDPNRDITFFGRSDPAQCGILVRSIFDLSSCRGAANCSLEGVYQPPVTGKFMGYAGFYYTAWALNLKGSNTLEKYNSTMWKFCSMNWTSLKQNYNITEKHLKSYCYSANYVHTILSEGYKFNADNWESLNFQREVSNTSIAWSLGYMLNLSNMIPAEAKLLRLPIENSVFIGLLFLFSALIIISVMYLIIVAVRVCF
ncbi:ectonucleoside triphosphate diphosphohydrolase 3 [Chanos chanos]|uniref:Ectonucleoside triphosphate diphosphohydrolase 3 n=1 Tax=Chanos chanos TaxID=29144 RepID=A0A6J2VZX6_CHACN|nr:ectonucleoside triphosphate diphosphohydrolase 3 [Chanos chanos]